jgi:uncharacterized protein (TIGR02646 family)
MIRVNKPVAPAKLLEGVALNTANCQLYTAGPGPYDNGTAKFEIERDVYGHAEVKDVLRQAQHKKCCFCEGIFEANAAADVEHYRPKKYAQQARGARKLYPGYYWLGYTWENLYYCCQVCNRSHKRNYFPLKNPAQRARNHLGNVAGESPLILDPGGPESPRDHIHFEAEVAIGDTDAGDATIDFVGLNRPSLIDARLETYNVLVVLRDVTLKFTGPLNPEQQFVVDDAQLLLDAAVGADAKFSAMAVDLLAAPPIA